MNRAEIKKNIKQGLLDAASMTGDWFVTVALGSAIIKLFTLYW